MNTPELIKKQTYKYINQLKKIDELTDYNVNITIEPKKENINFKPTGYVSSNSLKKFKSKETENEGFLTARKTNGHGYYYRGKLTLTVK